MAKHCINVKSPEFKQLVEESGINPLELAANISLWQDSNNTDEFPSVNQVKKFGEVLYQKQTVSNEGIIAAEKTIRDLAARMADRIGMKVKFESDRTKDYKGKIENNTAVINLANATLDTPIHEILGHPIIRTIKTGTELTDFKYNIKELNDPKAPGKFQVETFSNETLGDIDFFETKEEAENYVKSLKLSQPKTQLYQNLLKELETGRGKEVLDRIKRDYNFKNSRYEKLEEENDINYIESIDNFEIDKNKYSYEIKEIEEYSGYYPVFTKNGKEIEFEEFKQAYNKNIESLSVRYTLEEQQEEAIVELLGLMTAEKLDTVKDGKLISLLKRLLKEIKAFMRDLLSQREVEVDKLPDNMTLGDLSDLLAYSNSKLILPGNEVVYTTPDNQQFKTYAEASKYISDLARNIKEVDLKGVTLELINITPITTSLDIPENISSFKPSEYKDGYTYFRSGNTWKRKGVYGVSDILEKEIVEAYNYYLNYQTLKYFIEKNKEYEQSKEIIEEWKKVNNVQYNPEEVYSRGQGFYSIAGAFADFDVKLMFQNLLAHIEDNKKAGGQFTISATTDIPDHSKSNNSIVTKNYGKNIYYKIYPKSEDILWATPEDCASGSVLDASEKVGSKLGKEITGVSYTKYPSKGAIDRVQASLAETLDKTVTTRNFYNYNELGINLTETNFRLEYDEDIPYQTKNIINGINAILDQKYGKIIKPEIKKSEKGINPIQTDKTLKESIDSIANKLDREIIGEEYSVKITRPSGGIEMSISYDNKEDAIERLEKDKNKYKDSKVELVTNYKYGNKKEKEYTSQALINTKIAKLKEVAKKYPRILIRSEVKRILNFKQEELFDSDELPFQKVSQSDSPKRDRAVIPLSERPDLYKAFNLIDSKGEVITYDTKAAGIKRLNGLNKSSELYDFDIRETSNKGKWVIFPLRPIANLEEVVSEESSPMVDDRELYDTTGDMAKYGGDMFQLSSDKRQDTIASVENILKSTLANIGISVKEYANLQERLGVDAYGFTKLLAGNSEIGVAELRDKFTLSEESGHIYFEMLRNTPFYDRVLNELEKEDYYKTVLDWDGNFQEYYDQYKGNKLALKREAAGKLLGKTIFTKAEEIANQPTGIRLLLARIKDFLKKAIAKFNYNAIKPEIDLLMGEIADDALKGTMNTIGGDVRNISNNNEVLYRIKDNLQGQKELTTKMLESVIKRQQFYRLREDKEQVEKYQDKERKLLKFIDEVKHLESISFYLDSLKEEQNEFSKNLDISIDVYSKDKPFTPARIRKDSGSLRNMKFIIDANLTTVTAIVDELSAQYRYSKDDTIKEVLKPLLEEAKLIKDNFQEAENIYYDLGTTLVSAFLTPLLGNRNSQDLLDKINLNRPENKQLKPLNIKDALNLTEGDINMISRWMDALADTDDGILQLIDLAVKNQKIKSDEESLNDQKDLIDAQKKLNEGGISSTEFMAETYKGKVTGNFVTEYDWAELENAEKEFYSTLKEKYGVKSSEEITDPDTLKDYNEEIAKFYSKYTLSNFKPMVQGVFYMSEAEKFLAQKQQELSPEEYKVWEYFNTKVRDNGNIVILKNKSKQYQEIQNNPAKKEYYNTILKMKYDLDMLLPEKKRHPRRMIQIKKDWMERLKDATTSMDKEGLTNIMREIGEAFTIPEDADDRGVKFALSTDASKVVKFLPIYYINKLKNTSELSTDITGTMAVYSTMARDFAAMNEIVDTLEIARDLIDNREILSTDSKGNPIIESLKGSSIKMIRRITKQKGKSLSADRLAGYMDMNLYGELKADEGKFGIYVDVFTKYSALTSLGLNLFAGVANLTSGFSQMNHQALSNEYFGEKSTLYADKNYWQDIGNIVSGIGRLDNRSIITGKTAKVNLWRQHMNIQMDRKGDAKSLDAERKTMLGRLFDTSALFFINNIGEHYMQTRTSLALANNYRYDKKLNKFVWREEYFAEVSKLDLKRRQEIKELGKKPTKQDIAKINSKYKALSEELTKDLEASWKDMTNYYEAHENVNNRLKLKEGFKANLEDKQKFIHRTNALNKEFHGIYNDIDKNEAQRYALFRLAWQFRKWMVPYWNRRYGKSMYHAEKGDYQEGFYKVVGRFISQMYAEAKFGEFSLRKNWNMLSQQEKANFYKVMSEVGHILGFMALAALLTAGADDDEDNWWLQMGAYQANRAVTELGSMSLPWGFTEGLKMINQPIPGASHFKNLATLFAPWEWLEEIERGRYEGYTKFERMLIKGTPGLSQVKDWMYPEEKMVFYTGNK